MNCRGCAAPLSLPLIDLGTSPPSNAYVHADRLEQAEQWVPLKVAVCQQCWLVQTEDYTRADSLFDAEYAYFSSFSSTWLAHAERYVAEMVERFGLTADSRVVEVAANDGYLLQYVAARGIPCLGVEPTRSTAQAAREKGLEIRELFFGRETAAQLHSEGWGADLMAANNVLAHVPDINDFLGGFATLLKPTGVATFEFPQLLTLMAGAQFDTLYHEHYSYLSLTAVQTLCERNGLEVFDVSQLSTHGGSLRVFVQRKDGQRRAVQPAVQQQLQAELDAGVKTAEYYATLAPAAERIKHELAALSVAGQGRRQACGRLRRRRQGQHLAQLRRGQTGPAGLGGRCQPAQAGQVPAGQSHPDCRAGADRHRETGLRAGAAVEPVARSQSATGCRCGNGTDAS